MTEPVQPGGGPSYSAPAGPPSGPPAGPPYASPAGPPPRPPKGPGLWRQATSTTGGLVALIVAGCLAVLLVLGLIGAGLFVGSRVLGLGFHRELRVAQAGPPFGNQLAPGQRKRLMGVLPGPGAGSNGNGNGKGRWNGGGLGSLLGAGAGLEMVQHGELTVQSANGSTTAMTVQRGTVTAESGSSVTVKSADGFTATYAVDSSTRGRTTNLAKGDTVLVIAQKAGAKAVLIRAVATS